MDNINQFTIFNIRELLREDGGLGENDLHQILSEFTKKNQSITYLVFSNDNAQLVGYFTLTIKPIKVNYNSKISKNVMKKISQVSEYDEVTGDFCLAAYLIAQLGKNFTDGANKKITGKQFYCEENGFKIFRTRLSSLKESHTLVQMLKVL